MEYKDYYKILGVPRTATQADVKKAFRKLARQHHPDLKPGDKKAEQAFKDANEANEVLSDPAKRRQYDELGANWAQYAGAGRAGGPGGANPFAGANVGQGGGFRYEFRGGGDPGQFSDFFRTFFGGAASGFGEATSGQGGGRSRSSPGGSASYEDLVAGFGGASEPRLPPAEAEAEITLEEAFAGTTRLVDVDGKRLEVKLPAGVDTGSRIKLTGKGGGGGSAGGAARDLVIVPRVRPHGTFTRSGADLTRELRVTLREALLGGEVTVPTLKGRVLLTLPAGTQSGRTFRLTGQGMPRLKGEGRGDLYVKIVIVLPARLSDEAKAAAATFLDLVEQPDPRSG